MKYNTRLNIRKAIEDTCLIQGDFLLSSGVRSSYYFDKYLFESNPTLLYNIIVRMTEKTIHLWDSVDYIAGLEMGGISIATVLSQYMEIPMVQVRKKAKKYGTAKCIEGPDVNGKRVVIIEDVVTSGKAVLQATSDLRTVGAIVTDALCVILRDTKGKDNLDKAGILLYNLLDFTTKE